MPFTINFFPACDEYFSKMEAARIDQRAVQHEKEVLRKLENVKLDHERRLKQLGDTQRKHEVQGHLIGMLSLNFHRNSHFPN